MKGKIKMLWTRLISLIVVSGFKAAEMKEIGKMQHCIFVQFVEKKDTIFDTITIVK